MERPASRRAADRRLRRDVAMLDRTPPGTRSARRPQIASAIGLHAARRLGEYVGPRAIVPAAAGTLLGVLMLVVPAAAVTVGALLGASDSNPGIIVLGAFIGLAGPAIAAHLWRGRVWSIPVNLRLAQFEGMYTHQRFVTIQVAWDDYGRAIRALRRAGLSVPVGRSLGVPPHDAAHLDTELSVYESRITRALATEAFWQQIADTLARAKISYRQSSSGVSLGSDSAGPPSCGASRAVPAALRHGVLQLGRTSYYGTRLTGRETPAFLDHRRIR